MSRKATRSKVTEIKPDISDEEKKSTVNINVKEMDEPEVKLVTLPTVELEELPPVSVESTAKQSELKTNKSKHKFRDSKSISNFKFSEFASVCTPLDDVDTVTCIKHLIVRANASGQNQLFKSLMDVLKALNHETRFPESYRPSPAR